MVPLPGIIRLPPAIPPIGGTLESCSVQGSMVLLEGRTSRVSMFGGRERFTSNVGGLSSIGLIKLGARKEHRALLKRSTKYRISCIQCSDYLDPAKRSDWPRIDRQLNLQNRLLRYVAVRSDLVRSGTPDAASPLSELYIGPKARGVCFYAVTATVAIFLFVLMLVTHPFVLLFDRYRRRTHHLIAKIWASLTITPFFKVEFEGLEHLPKPDIAAVYVSNHQSFLDIYTLLTLGRNFKFISKTSIFIFPVIGWAMFLMGVIPLKRMDSRSQLDCLKRCMDLIRGGASVFFFPEGTRSKSGKLGAFKKGAFSVAAKTKVPVVPMTIMGTGNIMPAGQEGFLNPGAVKVIIHPRLVGDDAQELCDKARSIIAETLDQQD